MAETNLAIITPATPLPSLEQIKAWWEEYGMLPNIRRHSQVVCEVALLVTDWLAEGGIQLNRGAVEAGALLHDIAKTICLGTDKLHAVEGETIMLKLGFPEMAFIVKNHVYLPEGHPLDETMVVNYADKRVTHEAIVCIADRYEYIAERYGQNDPERLKRITRGRQNLEEVEAIIFSHIPHHAPDDIAALAQEVCDV